MRDCAKPTDYDRYDDTFISPHFLQLSFQSNIFGGLFSLCLMNIEVAWSGHVDYICSSSVFIFYIQIRSVSPNFLVSVKDFVIE